MFFDGGQPADDSQMHAVICLYLGQVLRSVTLDAYGLERAQIELNRMERGSINLDRALSHMRLAKEALELAAQVKPTLTLVKS